MWTLLLFFGWPLGAVWPNLLASALCFGAGIAWSHRRLTHKFADQLRRELAAHHESLARHITDTAAAPPTDEHT